MGKSPVFYSSFFFFAKSVLWLLPHKVSDFPVKLFIKQKTYNFVLVVDANSIFQERFDNL